MHFVKDRRCPNNQIQAIEFWWNAGGHLTDVADFPTGLPNNQLGCSKIPRTKCCLLYTSDAADE